MTKKIFIPFLILLFVFSSGIKAQQVVASGGAYYNGGTVSLSWTIGETVVKTFTGGSVILTQGFQQGYISSNAIEDYLVNRLNLKVYPNPVSEIFSLLVENEDYFKLEYTLHDISGKVLSNGLISSDLTSIDIRNFPDGIYLLRVIKRSGEPLQSFRIIKQ
jgi:hypothetical protein